MMRKLSLIGIVLILLATGFYREFVFVNINEQLRFLWFGNEPAQVSKYLAFLSNFSYWPLYYFKWVLTVLFSALFLLEAALLSKVAFNQYSWKEVILIYAALLLLSALFFCGFYLFGHVEDGYTIARYLMGIAQSPVPAMILIPALYLRLRFQVKS